MNNGPPYLLVLVFGLLISACLHFILVWPSQEPDDDDDDDAPPSNDTSE